MKKKIPLIAGSAAVLLGILIAVYVQMQQMKKKQMELEQQNIMLTSPSPTPLSIEARMGAVESSVDITVVSPSDNTTVATEKITVKGKTLPKAEVFVNEKQTVADANGAFVVSYNLEEGENHILFVANDEDGNAGEKELVIIYTKEGEQE